MASAESPFQLGATAQELGSIIKSADKLCGKTKDVTILTPADARFLNYAARNSGELYTSLAVGDVYGWGLSSG